MTRLRISPREIINSTRNFRKLISELRVLSDTRGQDLIEYALIVGFIAVAAGALVPGITTTMRNIFERVSVTLANSANQQ